MLLISWEDGVYDVLLATGQPKQNVTGNQW